MGKSAFLFFLCFIASLQAPAQAKNQFTLHLIPSPKKINWSTPQSLTRSTLRNQMAHSPGGKLHSIGHVYEELECGSYHRYLGMTDNNNKQETRAIFIDKIGLGVLLKKYVGSFDNHDETEQDLKEMNEAGRSSYLTFMLSDSMCHRIMDYIDEYQRRGYDRIYAGLDAHPLRGEGAGCSAFGASFLEIANLKSHEFEQSWTQDLIVPYKYIGGPLTGKKVSLFKLLFARKSRWASTSADGVPIHFFDPDRMHAWVVNAVRDLDKIPARTFDWPAQVDHRANSAGIVFDVTQVATPTWPFFDRSIQRD